MPRVCPDASCKSENIMDMDEGAFMCEDCGKELTEADFKYQGYKIGERNEFPPPHTDGEDVGWLDSCKPGQNVDGSPHLSSPPIWRLQKVSAQSSRGSCVVWSQTTLQLLRAWLRMPVTAWKLPQSPDGAALEFRCRGERRGKVKTQGAQNVRALVHLEGRQIPPLLVCPRP